MYNKDVLTEKQQSTDFEFLLPEIEQDNIVNLPKKREGRRLRISILGLGYVGAVSSACFCRMGHRVIGVDPDGRKVEQLNLGRAPIVEDGLDDLLSDARQRKTFFATTYVHQAIQETEVTLVSICTPSAADGSCDLTYLKQAAQQMGEAIRDKRHYHVFVYRSTVPPTTTRKVMIPLIEAASGKRCGPDFGVAFNPEFLRESTAVDDFYHPPKTVVGGFDSASTRMVEALYSGIPGDFICTTLESAEFVKYVDNTWHALKVTFANEVGRLCKAVGVDSHDVMDIFLADTKLNISSYYLKPGFAFGGSCLPKDTRGIAHLGKQLNLNLPVINHINASNLEHIEYALEMVAALGIKRLGIVGLTFKAGTDDLRESPSLHLLKALIDCGYEVKFYDPCIDGKTQLDSDASTNSRLQLSWCPHSEQLLGGVDAVLISHTADYARSIVENAPNNMPVIDLVRARSPSDASDSYQGLCW